MKYRGIVYDVGLRFEEDKLSVEPFDTALVEYDMRVIAKELYANAVRIEGEPIDRLAAASRIAHGVGLTVYFNPWKMHGDIEQTRHYLEEAAIVAQVLKTEGIDIVFVAGCEYTIFSKGVFPGETFNERLSFLGSQLIESGQSAQKTPSGILEKSEKLNEALRSFVDVVRARFDGPVTYSAGTWEMVDWTIFDIVGVDYYRQEESEEQYISGLERYRSGDKPLVVMEFGCCAYKGAAKLGGGGFMLLKGSNPDGTGIFENDVVPTRSEKEQADYVGTQLGLFEGANVHATFVYVYSFPCMPIGEGARDMDMMSFSLVKTFPSQDERSKNLPPWERKESFHRVAEFYRKHAAIESSH